MVEQSMVPQVTNLVAAFLGVMKARVLSCQIRECWPTPPEQVPWQNMEGVQAKVVARLDEDTMCMVSLTAWHMFAFPEELEHWWGDLLSYIPGGEINVGVRMLDLPLVTANVAGQYGGHAHILSHEGQMLVYDLSSNFVEWVPMCGVSANLTVVGLKSACELSNIVPHLCQGDMSQTSKPAKPFLGLQEAEEIIMHSETVDTDSEAWDDEEEQTDWSHCLSHPPEDEGTSGYGAMFSHVPSNHKYDTER